MQIKICQRSALVWLMSVLQISRTIPYNARKAVAEVRKIQAGKEVTKREDMEKAFPPVFSNLNLVVVAGNGPVEKCRAGGQQAAASGALLVQYVFLLYRPELHIKGKISIRNLIYKMRYNRPLLGGQQSAHFSLLILWPQLEHLLRQVQY